MINSVDIKKFKEAVEEFFQKATLSVEVEILPGEEEGAVSVNLTVSDPQILIGERGQTLLETQRLLKAVLKRKLALSEPFYLNLDINSYKQKKREYLQELARSAADEVSLSRKEKVLPPMSAYERRTVHLELAGNPRVETESIGQGQDRRLVVRPSPQP